MEWMPFRRYADFSGRSRRKEFWMYTLFLAIVMTACFIVVAIGLAMAGSNQQPGLLVWVGGSIMMLFTFASIVPSLAVQVRRLHDQDKSGWFLLMNFVPFVGGIIFLVFMLTEGTPGENRFGPAVK